MNAIKRGALVTSRKTMASSSKRGVKSLPPRQTPVEPIDEGSRLPAHERLPLGLPILYADQVIDVIYGIHTSKIVLGVETGNGLRPVGVASLPTAALLGVASTVIRDLTSPALVDETRQRLGEYLSFMGGMASSLGTTQPGARSADPKSK